MMSKEEDEQKDINRDAILEAKQSVQRLKASFEQNVEVQKEISKLLKARYDTLLDAGFNETQALQIVMTRGIS